MRIICSNLTTYLVNLQPQSIIDKMTYEHIR